MKNPCSEECLIIAACTEVCNAKINYGTLVECGTNRWRQYLINNGNPRFNQRTKAILKYYTDKFHIHSQDLRKISNRGKGLS